MDVDFKNVCMEIFDFTNNDNLMEKTKKYEKLQSIYDLFIIEDMDDENNIMLTNYKQIFPDILDVITVNIFRPLGPSKLKKEYINYGNNFEKCTSTNDLNPHLDIVYKILDLAINFFKNDHKYIAIIIDDHFVSQLLDLIHSDDGDERNYVSKIISTIYQYIPERRDIIDRIVNEELKEIVSSIYSNEVQIHLENLLHIYKLMMDRKRSTVKQQQQQQQFQMTTIKTLLFTLHRLPYLYYYYRPLFSCTIKFMKKYPEEIIDFMRQLFQLRNSSSLSTHSSILMLTLVELKQILNLLFNDDNIDIDDDDDDDSESIFQQIMPFIMPFLMKNLQSLNTDLIKTTINILCSFEYQKYFDKYMATTTTGNYKNQLISILNNQQYLITWDYRTHVQQVLYGIYLQNLNTHTHTHKLN